MSTTTGVAPTERDRALRTARRLNVASLGWNVVEAVVALSAAIAAGSLSLLAFGLDSCIEVSGALVLSWRLARERRDGCRQPDDRRATRALAISFFALAGYVGVQSVLSLVRGDEPSVSTVGIVLAAALASRDAPARPGQAAPGPGPRQPGPGAGGASRPSCAPSCPG